MRATLLFRTARHHRDRCATASVRLFATYRPDSGAIDVSPLSHSRINVDEVKVDAETKGTFTQYTVAHSHGSSLSVVTPPLIARNLFMGPYGDQGYFSWTQSPKQANLRADLIRGDEGSDFFDFLKRLEENILARWFFMDEMAEFADEAIQVAEGDQDRAVAEFIRGANSGLDHGEGTLRLKSKAFRNLYGSTIARDEFDFHTSQREFYALSEDSDIDASSQYIVGQKYRDAPTLHDGATLAFVIAPSLYVVPSKGMYGLTYRFDPRRILVAQTGRDASSDPLRSIFVEKGKKQKNISGSTALIVMDEKSKSPARFSVTGTVRYHNFFMGKPDTMMPNGYDGEPTTPASARYSLKLDEITDSDAQGSFAALDRVATAVVDFIYGDASLLARQKESWEAMIREEHSHEISDDDLADAMKEELHAFVRSAVSFDHDDPMAPRHLWTRAKMFSYNNNERMDIDVIQGEESNVRDAAEITVGSKVAVELLPFAYVSDDDGRAGVTFSFSSYGAQPRLTLLEHAADDRPSEADAVRQEFEDFM